MIRDDISWSSADVLRAPTWLQRISVYEDPDAPVSFGDIVDRFRSLEHLDAPLDAEVSEPLAKLIAKHSDLRSLGLHSRRSGVDTAALAALPLERVACSAHLLREAAQPWSAGLGGVGELTISGGSDTARISGPAPWESLRACESLDLFRVELDADTLAAIATLPALRRLTLRHCPTDLGALTQLASSPALERLTILGDAVSTADASGLAKAPALKVALFSVGEGAHAEALLPLAERGLALGVALASRTYVDDALVAAICTTLPGLAGLSLNQRQIVGLCKKLSPDGLAPIGSLSGLRWLSLDGVYIKGLKPPHLAFLGGLGHLRSLSLRNASKLSSSIIGSFVGSKSLRSLDLRTIKLSDAGAKKLATLPLRSLDLSDAKVGVKGLAALATMPELKALSIEHAEGFSDAMLAALAPAAAIESLRLKTSVSASTHPSDLEPLTKLPRLRSLEIAEVGITDAWIESLSAASSLESLSLGRSDCSFSGGSIGDAAVVAGCRAPALKTISHWTYVPSEEMQALIERSETGAWIPGGYPAALSIEPPEDAPLAE